MSGILIAKLFKMIRVNLVNRDENSRSGHEASGSGCFDNEHVDPGRLGADLPEGASLARKNSRAQARERGRKAATSKPAPPRQGPSPAAHRRIALEERGKAHDSYEAPTQILVEQHCRVSKPAAWANTWSEATSKPASKECHS